ncbi:MAG: hypothetical protein ABI120_22935 [Gemmatimonadaceae bacterium]
MKIQTRLLMMFCAALLGTACRSGLTPNNPVDAAVYAAVLDSLFDMQRSSAHPAVVLDDSTDHFPRDSVAPEFWEIFDALTTPDRSVTRNFESAVQTRIALRPIEGQLRNATRVPFVFSNATVYQRLRRAADSVSRGQPAAQSVAVEVYWQGFRETYPTAGGVVLLSAIGYSRSGRIAVVNVKYGCGGLCGEGRVVMLRRESNGWHVVEIQRNTVS